MSAESCCTQRERAVETAARLAGKVEELRGLAGEAAEVIDRLRKDLVRRQAPDLGAFRRAGELVGRLRSEAAS